MTTTIDKILELLAIDGNPHTVKEISIELAIPLETCERITIFLAKYNAIQFRDKYTQINPRIRDFILSTSDKSIINIPLLSSQIVV